MNKIDSISDNDDLLLAEYVLGVLEADERATVEAMLATRPEYAGQLIVWQNHLAPMLDELGEEAPPDFVWMRIRELIGERKAGVSTSSQKSSLQRWWDSLTLWRWFSAGGLTAAVILAAALVIEVPRDDLRPGAPLTAALQLETGQVVYTASVDAARRSLVMVPAADLDKDGRVAELWLIAGDRPPQSLGLLPADGAISLVIPEQLRELADASAVFAISLEPPGGSPTGLPTGPVVAQGALAAI